MPRRGYAASAQARAVSAEGMGGVVGLGSVSGPLHKAAAPRVVLMLAGGGLSQTSGGVGTLLGYLLNCWGLNPDGPAVRVVDTRGAGGVASGIQTFIRAFGVVLWALARRRLELVHAHMTTRGSVVRKCLLCFIANLFGVPTIIHQHGADFQEYFRRQPTLVKHVIQRAMNRAHAVIVLGETWRGFLTTEVGVAPEKIAVILNGVPMPNPSPLPAAMQAARGPKILFLGRLGDRKGVPELLAALSHKQLQDRTWHAVLAGDGEVDRFRREVAENGLSGRVDVLGWQNRTATAALLRQTQILVLPSYHEAMPVAVVEALSYGVTVITTPVGVIPEFLQDGQNALLVPPGDSVCLAEALARLLDDADLRRRLGRAGHEVFRSRLEIQGIAQQILRLYGGARLAKTAVLAPSRD